MKKLTILTILFFLFGCASSAQSENIIKNYIVLNYEDFGPQVIANEVIGMQWWQWDNFGDSQEKSYDIKVVVYNNIDLTAVSATFPVDQANEKDYRYLDYQNAVIYLNGKIDENVFPVVTQKLIDTRNKISVLDN